MAQRDCDVCGTRYEAKRPSSKYCSARCRNRKARHGLPDADVVHLPGRGDAASVVSATRAELAEAGRLDTHLGQAALALAERIDNAKAVMGFAALVKELRDTMQAALANVEREADTADEIREAALKLISSG